MKALATFFIKVSNGYQKTWARLHRSKERAVQSEQDERGERGQTTAFMPEASPPNL